MGAPLPQEAYAGLNNFHGLELLENHVVESGAVSAKVGQGPYEILAHQRHSGLYACVNVGAERARRNDRPRRRFSDKCPGRRH